MNSSAITYRKCTSADVDDAVPLIFESGPDAFNYVFRTDAKTSQGFLKSAFVTVGGEFSFDNHYVMLLDSKIIGIGSVFSAERARSFTFSDLKKIIKHYGWKCIPVLVRGLWIEQIIKLPVKNEISLAHITVHSDQRGRGFGQQLLEFLMSKVTTNSDSLFVLDVSEKNPRAKGLYERMGFSDQKFMKSNLNSNFGQVFNHYRMTWSPTLR